MKIKSLFTKAISKASRSLGDKTETGAKIASFAAKKALLISLLKYGVPVIAVLVIIVLLLTGFNSAKGIIDNATNLTLLCGKGGSGNQLVSEYEKEGNVLSDEDRNSISEYKNSNSALEDCTPSGSGYTGEFYPPTEGRISTVYGEFYGFTSYAHRGTDIFLQCGTPVYAFAGGTVTEVNVGSEAQTTNISRPTAPGNVYITHTPGFVTKYQHLRASTSTLKVGDIVSAGDVIGQQWANGTASGCHLHFEAWRDNERIDSTKLLLEEAGFPYSRTAPYLMSMFPPKPSGEGSGGAIITEPGSVKAFAASYLKTQGLGDSEFQCLNKLWERESNWKYSARNKNFAPGKADIPENQAYGIPQAGPGSKMASAGPDWKTNPQTQIKWGLTYIKDRYGTPCGAWAHSESHNWY